MSGTGPVEPANSTDDEHSWDVIGTDAPRPADRLTGRWRGLPPGRRRAVVATALFGRRPQQIVE